MTLKTFSFFLCHCGNLCLSWNLSCTLSSKTNSHTVVYSFFLIFFLILVGFVVMSPFPLVISVILTIISKSVIGYLTLSETVVQLML